ncbi:trypsin-like peptidase domain-containing protein [Christensenella massiliensis]|uniref:Trypsin-like peptidase domain-containing protein n=1 Tax=Christensenella massiliensis TaxID=1805714 RepID=A0AAU8A6Y8_9FIRM
MKKFFCVLLVIVLLLTSSAALAASVPQPVLDARESTVHIKVDVENGYSTGSGFAIGTDTPVEYIITNYHVIDEMTGACMISFGNYTVVNATVAVSLPDRDLAILKLDEPISSMKPLPLYSGEPSALAGEQVYALGFPGVADDLFERSNSVRDDVTMTDGIISAVKPSYSFGTGERTVTGLQINVALNHGNSGGPLVNGEGIVVGVNTIGSAVDSNLNGAVCISELLSTLDAKGISYLSSASPVASATAKNPWLIPAVIAAAVCAAVVILLAVRRRKKTRGNFVALNTYLAESNGKMGYDMTVYTLSPLFTQLKKAHENGQCLLGIYPENIRFYPEAGRAMLIPPKKQALCMGYSAPEQYKEIPQTGPWTDVYQLGALFYRMLTGVRLADVMTRAEGDAETTRNIEALALVPAKKEALLQAVSLNRSERFVDIGAFLEALEIKATEAVPDLKSFSVQKKTRKKMSSKKKRRIFIFSITGCAIAIICIFTGLFITTNNQAYQYLENKNYAQAYQTISKLPELTEDITNIKRISEAGMLLEGGQYEEVHNLLEGLEHYDMAQVIMNALYTQEKASEFQQVYDLILNGNFNESKALYKEFLEKYNIESNSEEWKELEYQRGTAYFTAKNYLSAEIIFSGIEDYSDARDKAKECIVTAAVAYANNGDFLLALSALEEYKNESDLQSLVAEITEAIYQTGYKTIRQSNYTEANRYFSAIPDYKDSRDYLNLLDKVLLRLPTEYNEYYEALTQIEELGFLPNADKFR